MTALSGGGYQGGYAKESVPHFDIMSLQTFLKPTILKWKAFVLLRERHEGLCRWGQV